MKITLFFLSLVFALCVAQDYSMGTREAPKPDLSPDEKLVIQNTDTQFVPEECFKKAENGNTVTVHYTVQFVWCHKSRDISIRTERSSTLRWIAMLPSLCVWEPDVSSRDGNRVLLACVLGIFQSAD